MGPVTHSEEQSRDGSAAFHMNHCQQTGEVALSGTGEEQPAVKKCKKETEKIKLNSEHKIQSQNT